MSPSETLDVEALRAALPKREIVVLEETTSTNDVVFELATRGAERVIVFAEHQTAGRGQQGRRWESAAGNGLCFSLLLKEAIAPNESWRVTRWAAETVATVLNDQFSLGATVKPPNDVYADARKIAGVLLELRALPQAPHAAILGIGVNVNQSVADFPPELLGHAGSIAMLTRQTIDRNAFAIMLLRALLARPSSPAIGGKDAVKFPMA